MTSGAVVLKMSPWTPLLGSAPAEVTAPVAGVASDELLFARSASGDRAALGELVGRYQDFLFGFLVRLTGGDSHRAEDFFQDTFLNAMRASGTFDKKKSFKPWITAIAVNLVRDDARRRKVRCEVGLEDTDAHGDAKRFDPVSKAADPSDALTRQDEDEKVRHALNRLTALEREVVLLHFYNDMTLQETALTLNAPLGTIKSRLHAALTRLNGMLSKA